MDRTSEFRSYLSHFKAEPLEESDLFYMTLRRSILEISRSAFSVSTLKSLLTLESKLNEEQNKANLLLGSIEINENDSKMHLEGIKYIINNLIYKVRKQIESSKNKLVNNKRELVLEKPKPSKAKMDFDYKNQQNQELELENKKILQKSQYEETKQRLSKIEAVQIAINENLVIQDERIDSIIANHKVTDDVYKTINTEFNSFKYNGSMLRRITVNIIVCLAFILLYIHIYYRKI